MAEPVMEYDLPLLQLQDFLCRQLAVSPVQ
jgi:hypothetical protein